MTHDTCDTMKFIGLLDSQSRIALLSFGATGVVLNCFALVMNMLLVEKAGVDHAVSYATVLLVVALTGFTLSRTFVFPGLKRSISATLPIYIASFVMFRLSDWLLFVILVYALDVYYLAAQVINLFLFFFLKFTVYKKIFCLQ